jgi:hypothetical protein
VGLNTVFHQTWVESELVLRVVHDLVKARSINSSPARFVTTSRSSCSRWVHGGDIQLNGLYEPPSACTRTDPSAFNKINRVASAKVGGESAVVIDRAPSNDHAHAIPVTRPGVVLKFR